MIRMAFSGVPYVEIADRLGMSAQAVGLVMRSPLAQAELRRMQATASDIMTNLPLRVALNDRLGVAADDAVVVNHNLMLDEAVPARTRASIARHFMDRVVFDKGDEDNREESYRTILRQLGEIKQTLGSASMLLPPVNGDSGGGPVSAGEALPESATPVDQGAPDD
jgi:hypothetical protein